MLYVKKLSANIMSQSSSWDHEEVEHSVFFFITGHALCVTLSPNNLLKFSYVTDRIASLQEHHNRIDKNVLFQSCHG